MAQPTAEKLPAYAAPAPGGLDDHTSASDTKGDLTQIDSAEVQDFVYVPDTEEERKLVRKIDIRLIPMLWVMYILNYVSVISFRPTRRARVITGGRAGRHELPICQARDPTGHSGEPEAGRSRLPFKLCE